MIWCSEALPPIGDPSVAHKPCATNYCRSLGTTRGVLAPHHCASRDVAASRAFTQSAQIDDAVGVAGKCNRAPDTKERGETNFELMGLLVACSDHECLPKAWDMINSLQPST